VKGRITTEDIGTGRIIFKYILEKTGWEVLD
jgi:hypothetical protein